jgi:hypothetical protein
MQAPPPRPHWSPVNPSILVSTALVILSALPHQIPLYIRRALRTPLGGILFGVLSAGIFWRKHAVLGVAMLIFLAGIWLDTMSEGFAAEILIKDKVNRKPRRWEGEEILSEDPHGIQERTDDQIINLDEVAHESSQWFDERVMDVHPAGIQERVSISAPEYDNSQSMSRAGH